jgi:rubrerythrin
MAAKKHNRPIPQGPEQRVADLVYEALETEIGGVDVYRTALKCAQNDELRAEWSKYLAQTERHVAIVRELCAELGLDPEHDTPGRQVVRSVGKALVGAMQLALGSVPRAAAQVVAAECVTLAETKDHLNWSLLAKVAEAGGAHADAIADAVDEVEDQEDEHLYHTSGWTRELWLDSLGLPAQLPPPEEEQDVGSMAEAAEAKASRKPSR